MTEIRPGIHHLKVPIPNNPLENTNVFLLRSDDGSILIDAGWNGDIALNALATQLGNIGLHFQDITRIIVTHAHHDHFGLAGRLRQLSGASVALHERDRDFLQPPSADTGDYARSIEEWFLGHGLPRQELGAVRMFAAMRRSGSRVAPDVILKDGDTITSGNFNLRVIWTPGHSPGHICLYEPRRRLLFAGDHILPVITPNVSLQPLSTDNPLANFLASLQKVRGLDVELVLPAHETPFPDLKGRVDEILHHHELRNLEILEGLGHREMTAYEVAGHVTWMPELGGARLDQLPPGDRRMALTETLAHLEALRAEGRVSRSRRGGMIYYKRS